MKAATSIVDPVRHVYLKHERCIACVGSVVLSIVNDLNYIPISHLIISLSLFNLDSVSLIAQKQL